MMGLNVRRTPGEKNSIQPLQQVIQPEFLGQRRNNQWKRISRVQNRASVLLSHHVKRVQPDDAPVGRNTNEWANGCHDERLRGALFSILNKPASGFSNVGAY
jgi:hypothetical protein